MTQTKDRHQAASTASPEHVLVFRIGERRFGLSVEGTLETAPAAGAHR